MTHKEKRIERRLKMLERAKKTFPNRGRAGRRKGMKQKDFTSSSVQQAKAPRPV